jgi:iron complex transport system permease protein
MKVTIDLDKLLEEGKITPAEHEKFSQFSARSTATLAFNLLVGFGVIAVSAAALALLPTAITAMALGLVIGAVGIGLIYVRYDHWVVFANMCLMVGALLFGAGVVMADEGSVGAFLVVAATLAAAGIFARSALLIVFAVLSLASGLGARTGYLHATYILGIEQPTLTVAFFTLFSIGAYELSKRLDMDYQGIAIAAARTGVFVVNFGFWIGSLWGDHIGGGDIVIADWVFGVLWALALMVTGVWAWRHDRRWVVNMVAVFGAIHFYTQWFERLGTSAETVLIAGLLALALALGLRALNAKFPREA